MQINIDATTILRPFRPADRDDLIAGINDWAVARWLARVPYPYRQDHADEFLGRNEHRDIESAMSNLESEFAFALCRHDRAIGGLVANPADGEGRREIGFWLARPFWGRQVMRRAVAAMMHEMLRVAPHTRIVASANHDNLRSQGLIQALGFVADGQREVFSTPLQRPVLLHCFRHPGDWGIPHRPPPIEKPP